MPAPLYTIYGLRGSNPEAGQEMLQLTSGTSNKILSRTHSWMPEETYGSSGSSRIPPATFWAKRFTANVWSNDMQLTAGAESQGRLSIPCQAKRGMYGSYTAWQMPATYTTYLHKDLTLTPIKWENHTITPGAVEASHRHNISPFSNGNLGLFWTQDNNYVF